MAVAFRARGVTGFACSGEPAGLYAAMGIDADGIAAAVREVIASAKAVAGPASAPGKGKPKKKAKKKAAGRSAKKKARSKARR